MKLAYPAVFIPHENGKGYTVEFPDLQGCGTEGDNLADAIIKAQDAASKWVLDELECGFKPPVPTNPTSISVLYNDFVSVVLVDMDAYAKKYSTKLVKKSVTIPAWLNTFAEESHLNLSHILHSKLLELFFEEKESE